MQNWTNILWLFLVIGAPAISWTVTKLREQYERKRLRDLQRVREEESIRVQRIADRTNRPTAEEERDERLAELAARRQAQLDQLRQRRGQAAPPGPVVLAPPTTMPRPTAGPPRPGVPTMPRPGIPQPQSQPQRPVRRTPVAAPTQRPRPVQRPAPQIATPEFVAPRPAPQPQAPERPFPGSLTDAEAQVRRKSAPTVGDDVRALLRGSTPGSTRRLAAAFALSEVLAKPVGIRSQTSGGMTEF